jgi:hypothetical protein
LAPCFRPPDGLVVAVQDLGIEVKAVRPNHRPQLGVNPNAAEELRVLERLAHRPEHHVAEVDFALDPIVEAQPKRMVIKWLGVSDSNHDSDARGGDRSPPSPALASAARDLRFPRPSHWIMQTRQFTNLKRRVARDSAGVDGATVTAFAGTGNAN